MHGKTSKITHDGDYLFSNIKQNFTATRYHSLVIDPDSFPESLIITARTDDSDKNPRLWEDIKTISYLGTIPSRIYPNRVWSKLLENFINV